MQGASRAALVHAVQAFEASPAASSAEVSEGLYAVAALLDREPSLRRALTDPGLPDDRKTGLLRELLGERAHPQTLRLVEIAVTRSRGRSVETALDELADLAAQRRQRFVAQVRVARPLEPQQEARLTASLERLYGRQVQLQVDVDPAVLGGISVRVGDEVLDGTVQRNLEAVRRTLAR